MGKECPGLGAFSKIESGSVWPECCRCRGNGEGGSSTGQQEPGYERSEAIVWHLGLIQEAVENFS